MTTIERLYYNIDKLSDDWECQPEISAASDRLEKALGRELYTKYEDEISDHGEANLKDGFIKGFQYAVSLLTNGKTVNGC